MAKSLSSRLMVAPGCRYNLTAADPRATPGAPAGKKDGVAGLKALTGALGGLQERLYAEAAGGGRRSILVVLQGIDTSGKDGTIKHVIGLVNPQGTRITAFKKPTEEERRHHFLWRIRSEVPAPGIIGIFNRSHYEDVIVPTVDQLLPGPTIDGRYDEINSFEAGLVADGVTVLKVFLQISYNEQGERLLDRLRDDTKRWKFSPSDLATRAKWPQYIPAYETMLARCSTAVAPWHVVPADRKWYRNWAVATLLRETLERLDPQYPTPSLDVPALERSLLETLPAAAAEPPAGG